MSSGPHRDAIASQEWEPTRNDGDRGHGCATDPERDRFEDWTLTVVLARN